MAEDINGGFDVDSLLNSLFPAEKLSDLFEKRLKELNINPTNALEILDIEYRALQGILHGTNKRVDYTNFIKIASFLQLPKEKVLELYFEALEKNYPESTAYPQDKIDFIVNNFDLAILRKAGFISSIHNYREIESKINSHFGFSSILEYKLPSKDVAFSEGTIRPKNNYTRGIWISSAINTFEEIANPYEYNIEKLVKYLPEIRRHSINVEEGMLCVIRELYTLGVTILYQASLPTLQLKGATLAIKNKPCIVLANYKGLYTTLWHTLCHEVSHVLFDFEDIKKDKYQYHISEDGNEEQQTLSLAEKEKEADRFAREYLFSKQKSVQVEPHMNNKKFVEEFADQHQVHPSFIYTYYAYDFGKESNKVWAKAQNNNPDIGFIKSIENPWDDNHKPIKDHVKYLRKNFNLYR